MQCKIDDDISQIIEPSSNQQSCASTPFSSKFKGGLESLCLLKRGRKESEDNEYEQDQESVFVAKEILEKQDLLEKLDIIVSDVRCVLK